MSIAGWIVFIVLGGVAIILIVIALIVILIICLCRCCRRRNKPASEEYPSGTASTNAPLHAVAYVLEIGSSLEMAENGGQKTTIWWWSKSSKMLLFL